MRKLLMFAVGIAFLLGMTASLQPLKAQVYEAYKAPAITIAPYQELTGATVAAPGQFGLPPTFATDLDDGYYLVNIGFPFKFVNVEYTQLYICVNGFVTFTRPPNVPAKNPNGLFISSPSYPTNVIAPFWGDHYYRTATDVFDGYIASEISYKTEADRFIIQWKNLNINDPSIPSSVANFQVILYKSTDSTTTQGNIEFAYGQIGGNPNTPLTNVITKGASVGLKGEFLRPNDRADFLNGLYYNNPSLASVREDLTNEWTPSGGTDKRILFTAVPGFEAEFWGDGDVDFSKTAGHKHAGLDQSRYVTVNDARLIMHSISSEVPLDSLRRRAAFHGDVNHNGRYYYDNAGVRRDIPWRDPNVEDNLPPEINTAARVFFQATEFDAALIMAYTAAKVPQLPWLLDTIVQHGRINPELEVASGVRFGSPVSVGANVYRVPVYINGYYNGPVSLRFNVNGVVNDVVATTSETNKVMTDFSNNVVVLAGNGEFDAQAPVASFTFAASSPELNVTNVRFNDNKAADVKFSLANVEENETSDVLLQNTPNPVQNSTTITVNVNHSGIYTLAIFDALGNKVKTVYTGEINSTRSFEWNGTDDSGARLESGMYIYRLTDGNVTLSRKLMLTK